MPTVPMTPTRDRYATARARAIETGRQIDLAGMQGPRRRAFIAAQPGGDAANPCALLSVCFDAAPLLHAARMVNPSRTAGDDATADNAEALARVAEFVGFHFDGATSGAWQFLNRRRAVMAEVQFTQRMTDARAAWADAFPTGDAARCTTVATARAAVAGGARLMTLLCDEADRMGLHWLSAAGYGVVSETIAQTRADAAAAVETAESFFIDDYLSPTQRRARALALEQADRMPWEVAEMLRQRIHERFARHAARELEQAEMLAR